MILEKLKIKNFGTFDRKTSIDLKGSFTTIIGDNGTGKSTILFAIKILLDWQTRRKGISEEWIPNLNEPTLMEFVFDASSFSKLNVFLPIEENRKIRIKLEFKFETEFNLYFPIVYIGIIEELKYLHSQKLPFDNFIQLVHINARSESKIHEWIEEKYKNSGLLDVIQLKINKANQEISGVDEIKSFNDEVNQQINHIFQEEKFKVSLQSNVQTTKIGKALNFFPTYNQKNIVSHGEGFEKIIAIMSNLQNTNDNNKIRIILLDEMENNLFYIYQSKAKRYLSMLLEYSNVSQIIVTTHSPNIVQISPDSAITKLRTNAKPAHFLFGPSWNFDYYQKNLAIAIFYEFVLVVEGHSEKMFFEYIFKKNQFMKDKIDVSKIFILNNQGIHFVETVLFLKKLVKKVIILTDNDKWSNNEGKEEKCMGLKRIWDLCEKLENKSLDQINFSYQSIINNGPIVQKIIQRGQENNIFTQPNIGQSFEEALLSEGVIDQKEKNELEKSKLKNLSKIITDISKKINLDIIDNSLYLFAWIKKVENES